MSKSLMVGIVILVGVLISGLLLVSSGIGFHNDETRLRNLIAAKQDANTTEFDNMWKKINQTVQVADAQKDALVEIFSSYAESRSQNDNGGQLMLWVKESVPNADLSVYNQVVNIITSSRDTWTRNQRELVDLARRHKDLITTFPGNVWASLLGREEIKVTLVTSSRTQKAFETGVDDDVDLSLGK